jgi:hypothetical protein
VNENGDLRLGDPVPDDVDIFKIVKIEERRNILDRIVREVDDAKLLQVPESVDKADPVVRTIQLFETGKVRKL